MLVRTWALEVELDRGDLTVGYVELTSGDEETGAPEVEGSRPVRLFLFTLPVVSAAEPLEVNVWGSPPPVWFSWVAVMWNLIMSPGD